MVLLYGHELRRMARFLRVRDGRSNSRLTTEMPGPGFADLARAVNGTLDAADQRERERAARAAEKQREQAMKTVSSVIGQIGRETSRQLLRGLFGNLRK